MFPFSLKRFSNRAENILKSRIKYLIACAACTLRLLYFLILNLRYVCLNHYSKAENCTGVEGKCVSCAHSNCYLMEST